MAKGKPSTGNKPETTANTTVGKKNNVAVASTTNITPATKNDVKKENKKSKKN